MMAMLGTTRIADVLAFDFARAAGDMDTAATIASSLASVYTHLGKLQEAVEFLRSGKLGKVRVAKAINTQRRENIGKKADGKVPED